MGGTASLRVVERFEELGTEKKNGAMDVKQKSKDYFGFICEILF